jgi:hypothetical protein
MSLVCNHGRQRAETAPGALHTLKATPETVHWGYFSPSIKPALTIKSGDLVHAEAITHHAGDAPDLMFDEGVERIFTEIDPTTRAPGVHIMTGPIYVEGAEPGDMLEVRYLSMEPRNPYGSNLAANWGHLYQEFDEKERVTIYRLDAQTQTASALYAYDFPGKYLVPGTITNCPVCDRQPALPGVTIPARPHLGTAGVAPAVNEPVSTIPPASTAATSTTGASARARRCTTSVRSRAGCSRSAIPMSARATARFQERPSKARSTACSRSSCARISSSPRPCSKRQNTGSSTALATPSTRR